MKKNVIAHVASLLVMLPAAGFLAAGPAAAENQLSESERAAGWKLLFDGETTDGWRNYAKDGISDGWRVVDGALSRVARGAGDIVTDDQYDRFDLSLEYRISKGGNSGLMYHVTETEPAPWQSGPEIQIQDNAAGRDPQKAGWLYQLYQAEVDATRPAGEWNTLYLRVTPEQCVQTVNGVRYARYVKGSKDWDDRVAASKFRKYPNFGKANRGHICLQDHGNAVAFRNIKLRALPEDSETPNPVDGVLPYEPRVAFPELKWAKWSAVSEQGKPQALRPIVLTHAGDKSNRLFVATQQGVVHVFPNRQDVTATKVFLDIRDQVVYDDKKNEEGLLGLAFHPQYRENGEFFIYYTSTEAPHLSKISRFRVSPDDPDRADAKFEEEILRIEQPFWNHNGGTICFGPDGYLYIGLGDGGSANDPEGNGQNLKSLLGSILRIDVDRQDGDRNYAIPADNPFVGRKDARGEIWAYGLRNVWRMAFDPQTGSLWAADVGQNLWEEIDLIVRGGNYGWRNFEGTHPFGADLPPDDGNAIPPIWEYDHAVGKSITGGLVYRGRRLPQLAGAYLYGDYVTGKLWALRYDEARRQVLSNDAFAGDLSTVISYGADAEGEVYLLRVAADGRGIYRFEPTDN